MTDRTWQEDSLCNDPSLNLDPDLFFPARRQSIRPAQKVCATCPVWRPCLVASVVGQQIRRASEDGVMGGMGGSGRRALIRALRAGVDHDPQEECQAPGCAWCNLIRDHRIKLDVVAGILPRSAVRPIRSFGPGATHGRRITQARGCRCVPCRFAASRAGQLMAKAGVDPVEWWEWQFAPLGAASTSTLEWSELEERRHDAVLRRAKAAALSYLNERHLIAS